MKVVVPMAISDSTLISTNVPENLYPIWDSGYVYGKGQRVHVIGPNTHQVYESLTEGNTGHTPASTPAHWAYVSPTNPWKMLDRSVTSQTEHPNKIQTEIRTRGRALAIAVLNASAKSVKIEMLDAVDGVVHNQTYSMVSSSGVDDWYDYFFEPVVRLQDLLITDLPSYSSPVLRVTLDGEDEVVKCGALVVGPISDFGHTQYGVEVGIRDFSRKEQDDFGNYTIIERAFSKRAKYPLLLPKSKVDGAHQMLASLRATPVVYIGTEEYSSTAVYGFYVDFNIEIAYQEYSVCTVEVEGLT
jgi:hypothetical protein